jgi:hypothetical protein
MTGIGPGEWAIHDANGKQLLNVSADHDTVDGIFGEEEAREMGYKNPDNEYINVFTAETQATGLVDRPGDIFENLNRYGIPDEKVPLLLQLELLMRGPK